MELLHLPFLFEYNKPVKSELRIFPGTTLPQMSNFASELSSLEAGTVAEHSIRCDIIVGYSGIFFLLRLQQQLDIFRAYRFNWIA